MMADRRASLYLGLDSPDGTVTDAQWSTFVARDVASRFPAGFTATDALGGWTMADGRAIVEPSKVLTVLYCQSKAANVLRDLHTIADTYKARFKQESVILTVEPIEAENA